MKNVAVAQKGVIICLLVHLLAGLVSFVTSGPVAGVAALISLLASVVAAVFVFIFAIRVYGTGMGVVLGILTLVPLVGLIVLLVINSKATNMLHEAGYKVGFLGVSGSQF